jgi:long-chain acyl-CoA synthetase
VGRALPGCEIEIRDEEMRLAPPGEPGQVWVRHPDAERFSYWGDPAKTEAAWRDGAFSVGDLGWLDHDRYLFLTGRRDDTIITGGVNVYPQEVELALADHPAVAEAVVFGVASEEWGQEVRAQVVPAAEKVPQEELLRWLRGRLASYKCPRRIEWVEVLERTATGKLRRPGLYQM